MAKLIILNFQRGSFEDGFEVSLQIEEIQGELVKKLPGMGARHLSAAPTIPKLYEQWLSTYKTLAIYGTPNSLRLSVGQGSSYNPQESVKDCLKHVESLQTEVKNWLKSQGTNFQDIREQILTTATNKLEELRVFIQTKDDCLKRLPWHYWDFLDDTYPHAEIALCPLDYGMLVSQPTSDDQNQPAKRIKILAILGNNNGINVTVDCQFLTGLVGEENCRVLPQPSRSEISNQLWDQAWDILFFAGHSKSGFIGLNSKENLSIAELRQGLRTAIRNGLQLAIFNSCDGLKLAEDLADLQIPQVIVMREPVPDKVAQEFLKLFLTPLANGQSLYLSMREARGRLFESKWNKQFPGASWLPIIYQNPVARSFEWPTSEITKWDILKIINDLASEHPNKYTNRRVDKTAIIAVAKTKFNLLSFEVEIVTQMLTELVFEKYLEWSAGNRYKLTDKPWKN